MGEIRKPPPVKLICGLLAGDDDWLERGREALAVVFGPIDGESAIIAFDFTDYYADELGPNILRQFVSFEQTVPPEKMAGIKRETNRLEEELSGSLLRKINLDPGYLDLSKMVLASTKDATYRVYLGEGIYAQATYYFEKKTYRPYRWTYADYQTETAIDFFNRVRDVYKRQLRQ